MSQKLALLIAMLVAVCWMGGNTAYVSAAPDQIYTVNSNGDASDKDIGDGICADASVPSHCTLRAAIQTANSTPGLDEIDFNITFSDPADPTSACPGGPLEVICPKYNLPTITAPVIIDGTTQAGYAPGTPVVELDGNNEAGVGPGVDALLITAGGSTIRGIWIHSYTDNGIDISVKGGNVIEGNWIGDVRGVADSRGRNYSDGISISNIVQSPAGNTIGGTTLEQRNVITGNGYLSPRTSAYGVTISGAGSRDNVVQGNYIGTEPDGAAAEGNTEEGVYINGAPNNTVGGTSGTTPGGACTGACNVISDNDRGGVLIAGAGATGNVVEGNFIGTTASGLAARGNTGNGVYIDDASNNTVGGTTAAARNVISRNTIGVRIEGATSTGNIVEGNYIGLPSTGAFIVGTDLGNSTDGVNITGGSNNTIGGTTGTTPGGPCTGACNVLSDNGSNGVEISGSTATGNVVEGNYIGLDWAGEADPSVCITLTGHEIGNTSDGVYINGASGNRIGGTTEAARNYIGCNGPDDETDDAGIEINGSAAQANVVVGNSIGLTASGASAGNSADGVRITQAHDNIIGGSTSAEGNLIAYNGWSGVQIRESAAHANVVRGNILRENGDGVYMNVAPNNIIGGTAVGDANVIVLNTRGVTIYGSTGTGNVVRGNFIGTNAAGDPGLGNTSDGVFLSSAPGNIIGGTAAGARNIISGNGASGIDIYQAGASGNTIQGNYIGTDPAGTVDLGNASDGIWINNAPSNVIGGTTASARNVISANGGNGVNISGLQATANVIQGNYIGANAAGTGDLGNGYDGVRVGAYSSNTSIGGTPAGAGNIIAFNDSNGVLVDSSTGNGILGNSIFSSQALGIDLVTALEGSGPNPNDDDDVDSGGNNYQNYPVLTSAVSTGGNITIQGTFNSTPSTNNFRLEFFASDSCDPTTYGEGKTFLGFATVSTNAGGDASVNVVLPVAIADGWSITATATDPANNTSEFSQCRQVTGPPDTDSDGVPDALDNCPLVPNPDQANTDGQRRANGAAIEGEWASNPSQDRLGDACDPDDDNDGLLDTSENDDHCPYRLVADSDGDTVLDGYEVAMETDPCDPTSTPACTSTTDSDGDGFPDCMEHSGYNTCAFAEDTTPGYSTCANPTDSDGDGCEDWIEIVDISGNREANVVDVLFFARRAVSIIGPSDSDPLLDVSKNGAVNVVDVLLAARNSSLLRSHSTCLPE